MRGGAGPGGGAGGLELLAGASTQRLERPLRDWSAMERQQHPGLGDSPLHRYLDGEFWRLKNELRGLLGSCPLFQPRYRAQPCPLRLRRPRSSLLSLRVPNCVPLAPAAHVVSSRPSCPRPCPLSTRSPCRVPSAPTPHIVSFWSPRVLEDTAWRAAGTARMGVCGAGDRPLLDAGALGRLFPAGTHVGRLG